MYRPAVPEPQPRVAAADPVEPAPGRPAGRHARAPEPGTAGPSVASARSSALDGVRGLAIVLVMVNHAGFQLWDISGFPYDVPYLRGLFGGGAVVVFFVVGGFIVTHSLVRDLERGTMDAVRFYLRRLVRLGVQLTLLGVALIGVQRWDPNAPGTMQGMVQNVTHVLTYTLNLAPGEGQIESRTEVGHLWYLSVQQQAYLVLPFVLLLVWRGRALGAALLTALVLLVYWHRQEVVETQGWLPATIGTTTRVDGLLWGVVLALLLPWLGRFRHWGIVLVLSALASLGHQLYLQEIPPFSYLGPWSLGYQFFLGVLVVSIWLLPRPTLTSRLLGLAPLAWLGRNSLTLYLWHLPVFLVIGRNLQDWEPWSRAVVAFAVLGVLAVVMERAVEDPTRRLLATPPLLRPPAAPAARPAPAGGTA